MVKFIRYILRVSTSVKQGFSYFINAISLKSLLKIKVANLNLY